MSKNSKLKQLMRPSLVGAHYQDSEWVVLDDKLFDEASLVCVQANQGSGKSYSIAAKLRQAVKNVDTIAISGLRSIVSKLSSDIDIDHYMDKKICPDLSNGLAVCLQSLCKFEVPDKPFILFIEEVDFVFRTLVETNMTMNYQKKIKVTNHFLEMLTKADKVIIASANIFPEHVRFFEEFRTGSTYTVVNTTQKIKQADFLQYSREKQILNLLLKDIKENKKGFVFSTAKNLTMNIVPALEETGKKVLHINGDNSSNKRSMSFISDPDRDLEKNEWDWVVCTPAVSIGVSIETRDYFDKVYAFILYNHIDPLSVTQGLNRVRDTSVPRSIWMSRNTGPSFSEWAVGLIDNSPLKIAATEVKKRMDAIKCNYQKAFMTGLQLEGYIIDPDNTPPF